MLQREYPKDTLGIKTQKASAVSMVTSPSICPFCTALRMYLADHEGHQGRRASLAEPIYT